MVRYSVACVVVILNSFLFASANTIQHCPDTSCVSCAYPGNGDPIDSNAILGTYILESCEHSRFKIVISKKEGRLRYTIFDKQKSIKKGDAMITQAEGYIAVMLGSIGGIYAGDSIQIQNYGNAMNEFIHFTQCDEKYLTFLRKL